MKAEFDVSTNFTKNWVSKGPKKGPEGSQDGLNSI
jgi:hypothetical protein